MWDARPRRRRRVRALVIASANPQLFCAGADIKAFTQLDETSGRELLDGAHALLREMERSRDRRRSPRSTRSRSAAAASWRWRCDVRLAGAARRCSASPRSTSGSSPASAAPSGCRGSSATAQGAGDEPRPASRSPPRRRTSSGSSTASCPTTSCSTPRWPGRASSPARRRWRSSRSSACRPTGDLDDGIEAEKRGVRRGASRPRTRARASPPSSGSASRSSSGKLSRASTRARRADPRRAASVVALTGAGISVPSGIPDFRSPGTGLWENVDPMEVAHIDVWRRDPERFWRFYGQRFRVARGQGAQRAPTRARRARAPRAARRGRSRRTSTGCTRGGHARARRGARHRSQTSSCLAAARATRWPRSRAGWTPTPDGVPRCDCGAPAEARRRPVRRVAARGGDRRAPARSPPAPT